MERSRRRNTRSAGVELGGKNTAKKEPEKKKTNNSQKEKSSPTKTKKEEDERPESPFFGFTNADIPQPIVIKTEPVGETEEEEDCLVVSVSKGAAPAVIKTEKVEDDDLGVDTFHGFSVEDLPKPIVIKEEADVDDDEDDEDSADDQVCRV